MNSSGIRFHESHEDGVAMNEGRTRIRRKGAGSACAYSEIPLDPGQVFSVEIESSEADWARHIKVGLTQINPSDLNNFQPERFDMVWLLRFVDTLTNPDPKTWNFPVFTKPEDPIPESSVPQAFERGPNGIKNQIGVMYRVSGENEGTIQYFLNGLSSGSVFRIPLDTPIFAIVDLCGSTKSVKILETNNFESLKSRCRGVIVNSMEPNDLEKVPLPETLRDYVKFSFCK